MEILLQKFIIESWKSCRPAHPNLHIICFVIIAYVQVLDMHLARTYLIGCMRLIRSMKNTNNNTRLAVSLCRQ